MGKGHSCDACFGCWSLVLVSFTLVLPLSLPAVHGSDRGVSAASTTEAHVWGVQEKTASPEISSGPPRPETEDHLSDLTLVSSSYPLVPPRRSVTAVEPETYADQESPTQTALAATMTAVVEWDSDKPETHASRHKPAVYFAGLAKSSSTATPLVSQDESASFTVTEDTSGNNGTRITNENNESSLCLGCGAEINKSADQPAMPLLDKHKGKDLRVSTVMTSLAWAADEGAIVASLRGTKALSDGMVLATESREDVGSGDQLFKISVSTDPLPDFVGKEQVLRALLGSTSPTLPQGSPTGHESTKELLSTALSPDSAEKDHLLEVLHDAPTQISAAVGGADEDQTVQPPTMVEVTLEFAGGEHAMDLWVDKVTSSPAQGAHGSTDFKLLDLDMQLRAEPATTPPFEPLTTPEPTSDQIPFDILNGDYYYDNYDPEDRHVLGGFHDIPESWSDAEATTWPLPETYEDFTPYEPYFNPTVSVNGRNYDDASSDLNDENAFRLSTAPSTTKSTAVDENPADRQSITLEKSGSDSMTTDDLELKLRPDTKQSNQLPTGFVNDNSTECKNGYIRRNNTCKSICDVFPMYCYNGGQCYLVENAGVFCRCNTQDYIWHKGVRCESIVTDFQVMCIAIGSAALVLLLLFMMTVFFAKKLYLLKTENTKLRKRSRYRTPLEQHNDNFSLSTIAEGSHPNDDPNAPSKIQEPAKPPQKEDDEESFNIQNSLTPKHENNKVEENVEVNSLQNNLM